MTKSAGWLNGFQKLDKRQHRSVVPEKRETNYLIPTPAPADYLEFLDHNDWKDPGL